MSILIRDMDMPANCAECRLMADGWCYSIGLEQREKISTVNRPTWCPLIPVPPHGRLIDADAFSSEMKERQTAAIKWMRESVQDHDAFIRAEATVAFLSEVKLTLDKMPTIIPADKEAEA